jgi:DNA polymerase-3 subunit epsilon
MRPRRISFIDTETTGTDESVHEIVELAVVSVSIDLSDARSVCCLGRARPAHPETASPEALRINGYTPEGWKDAPPLAVLLERAAPALEGTMLAGHNVQFDIRFLRAAYKAAQLEFPKVDYRHLDTMSLAFPLMAEGQTDSLSLDTLCKKLGIKRPDPHRALDDAWTSYEVARRMLKERTWTETTKRALKRLQPW